MFVAVCGAASAGYIAPGYGGYSGYSGGLGGYNAGYSGGYGGYDGGNHGDYYVSILFIVLNKHYSCVKDIRFLNILYMYIMRSLRRLVKCKVVIIILYLI